MAASDAFIAMQRWPMTCSLEIAGLSRVNGTQKFLELVEADAIEMKAIIHWGQRNNWRMKQVESFCMTPIRQWGYSIDGEKRSQA